MPEHATTLVAFLGTRLSARGTAAVVVLAADRRSKAPERRAVDATYCFMHDLVGDHGGFEEASRALFAGDDEAFARETSDWPLDVREQLARFRDAATLLPRAW